MSQDERRLPPPPPPPPPGTDPYSGVSEGRVSWAQAAAMGGTVMVVAIGVGISMLDKADMLDLSTFSQVMGYLIGLGGAAGIGGIFGARRKS